MKLYWHWYRRGVTVSGESRYFAIILDKPGSISYSRPVDLFFLRKYHLQTGIGYNIRKHVGEHYLELRLLGWGLSFLWCGPANDPE